MSPRARKTLLALIDARRRDAETLVLAVWDQDGRADALRDRDAVLAELRRTGRDGAAVGVCVEALEAWLVADHSAFAKCFGVGPKSGLPGHPEADPRPKETLLSLLNELAPDGGTAAERYRKLACHVDVEVLAKRCPKGFGKLQEAVEEFLAPCFAKSA